MQTESELNSLEEESFHVLIFDLKTYQCVLSALLRAEAFLQTPEPQAEVLPSTFYLLHIIDPCTLISIQISILFATFTFFSLKLKTLAKAEWEPHLGGSKCVTAVSCTCPSKNFRGFSVVIAMDQCDQPSLGGLSSSLGPKATVWFAQPHCDAPDDGNDRES